MKNIARLSTSLFVAVVMALCALVMPAIAAQDEVRLYTTPATASLSAGTTATVQIRLSKTSGVRVDYVDAIITFPTSLLEATSISRTGSYFSVNNGPTVTYNNTAGTLRVTGNGTTLSTSADVLVASITLRVKTAGTAKLSFSQNSQAGDMVGANNINPRVALNPNTCKHSLRI